MVKIKTSKGHRLNKKVKMLGQLVTFDSSLQAEVTEEFAGDLINSCDDISYVEEEENEEVTEEVTEDEKEEILEPEEVVEVEITEDQADAVEELSVEFTPEESDESEEEQDDPEGESDLDNEPDVDLSTLTMDELREVATEAGLPTEEWVEFKGPQGKKMMLAYLASK